MPWKIAGFPWVAADGLTHQPVFSKARALRCERSRAAAGQSAGGGRGTDLAAAPPALPQDCVTCLTALPSAHEPFVTGAVQAAACDPSGNPAQVWIAKPTRAEASSANNNADADARSTATCNINGAWVRDHQDITVVQASGASTFTCNNSKYAALNGWSGFNGTAHTNTNTATADGTGAAALSIDLEYIMDCAGEVPCPPGKEPPVPLVHATGNVTADCQQVVMSDGDPWTRPPPPARCPAGHVWPRGVNMTVVALGQCLSCRADDQGHSCLVGDDVNLFLCTGAGANVGPADHAGTRGTATALSNANQQWSLQACPGAAHSLEAGGRSLLVSAMSGVCAGSQEPLLMVPCNCSDPGSVWSADDEACTLINT